jgi:hypothetical protein
MCSAHPSSAAASRRPKLPSPQLGHLPRLATHVAQPVHEPLAHSRENCLPFTNACSTENLPPLPDPLAVGLAIAPPPPAPPDMALACSRATPPVHRPAQPSYGHPRPQAITVALPPPSSRLCTSTSCTAFQPPQIPAPPQPLHRLTPSIYPSLILVFKDLQCCH